MERDLLKRELEAVTFSPKSPWQYPRNAFGATQTAALVKLFETSLIFGDYYAQALKNNFSIAGRLSIVDAQDFARKGGQSGSLGITDKKKGQSYLIDFHKRGVSTIEAAIHEGLHLISHPLKGAAHNDISFAKRFGYSLMEAVTQYFTRVMMIEAGIRNWKTNVYQKQIDNYLKPFFKVFTLLGVDPQKRMRVLGELVFNNNLNLLRACIKRQLLILNPSLPDREAENWANKIDLLLARGHLTKTVELLEFFVRKDYVKAEKIYADAFPKKK